MTYDEIADKHKMRPKMKGRFVAYMRIRWERDEERNCAVGYADKWAKIFLEGIEWHASDMQGRRVLGEIAGKL